MLSRAYERWHRAPLAFDVGVLVGVLLSLLVFGGAIAGWTIYLIAQIGG